MKELSQKEVEKRKRKEIREKKKALKELKSKERLVKKQAKEFSKQILIKEDFLEYLYDIPIELKVSNDYDGNYVVVATGLNSEEVFKYRKNISEKCANVMSDSGATHTYPYSQMRRFIEGYDKLTRDMKYVEALLSTNGLNLNQFKKPKKSNK